MNKTSPTIGLCLGGGGIKGLAHLGLLKLLDKHSIRPTAISGTSMGAILGALYASGLSGEAIEERVRNHLIQPGESLKDIYNKRSQLLKWTRAFNFEKARGGIVGVDGLFEHLFHELIDLAFDDLDIPFTACCADLHSGEEIALSSGSVLLAVRASMAVPGIFTPVNFEQRALIDGGIVNNVPSRYIAHCNLKIASDVISVYTPKKPKTLEIFNSALNIMIAQNTRYTLSEAPVDILLNIDTHDIDAFNVKKIHEALLRGDEAAQKIEAPLLTALEKLG